MKYRLKWLILLLSFPPVANAQLSQVGDFGLIDHRGDFQQMSRYGDSKAMVLTMQSTSCADNPTILSQFNSLQRQFADDEFTFMLLNSMPDASRANVAALFEDAGNEVPVLMDQAQSIAESLHATYIGETFVLRPRDGLVLWQGSIGDEMLVSALNSVQIGESPQRSTRLVDFNCELRYPSRTKHQTAGISYAADVVPILERRCVSCHNQGGIAPWAMSSHQMVQGWSPMIRETILTRRMPPGQVDREVGHLDGVNELTVAEEQTLLHWIAMGSQKAASEPDPLTEIVLENPQWPLGEPDYILKIEPQTIPATGLLDYYHVRIINQNLENKWIRKIDVNPGNRDVVHHVAAYLTDKDSSGGLASRSYLIGWTPGRVPVDFPDHSGQLLPASKDIIMELHYTTTGKETTDQTQIGLYFWDSPPANVMRDEPIVNASFRLLPNERNHRLQASRTFNRDFVLYGMTPHMHYRGKAMRYTAVYPDGSTEELLSVPNYQFAWQYVYHLAEPKLMPAGTKIIVSGAFDNSAQNPYNPDPNATVRFGEQTYDEMFIGMAMFRYVGETPQNYGTR